MRRLVGMSLSFVLLVACKGEDRSGSTSSGSRAEARCDLVALEHHAERIEAADFYGAAISVWPGIDAACGEAVPEAARVYFAGASGATPPHSSVSFAEMAAFKRYACPAWSEPDIELANEPITQLARATYRACDVARFEVIEIYELGQRSSGLMSWGMHRLLLEQGLDPARARALTRALHAIEQLGPPPFEAVPELRWPRATGRPLEPGIPLYVSPTQIRLEDRELARLEAGRLLGAAPEFGEALAARAEQARAAASERDEPRAPLIFVADAQTPWATVFAVLEPAARAGFGGLGFVVQPHANFYSYVPVAEPERMPPPPPKAVLVYEPGVMTATQRRVLAGILSVELSAAGYSFVRGHEREAGPSSYAHGDLEPLRVAARKLSDQQWRSTAVVSADGDVTLEELVAVLAILRGAECESPDSGCLVDDLRLVYGGEAHDYVPVIRRGFSTDDDVWGDLIDTLPAAPDAQVRLGKAEVGGSLDAGIIRRIVRAHIEDVRSCYEAGLERRPELEGRVVVAFEIAGNGKVARAQVESTTVGDAPVARCVARAVKRWRFHKPADGASIGVRYLFVLDKG